jgi:hypothetical protein
MNDWLLIAMMCPVAAMMGLGAHWLARYFGTRPPRRRR